MTHHSFQYRLREHREKAGREPEDVDRHLGVDLGTCEDWENGAAKPGEGVIGVIAAFLRCTPQDLDRFVKLEVSDQLAQFAATLNQMVGDGLGVLRISDYWRKAQAKRSFRGAAATAFWEDFFEGEQDPPRLDLE